MVASFGDIEITPKPQKTPQGLDIQSLTEDEAREYLERLRWPSGPACPRCRSVNVYRMSGKSIRDGLLSCRDCNGQFTVTVGTVMADSHLPLATWIRACHLISGSRKGMSALQLQERLEIGSYRTALRLAHRIQRTTKFAPLAELLREWTPGDEAAAGGKPRRRTR